MELARFPSRGGFSVRGILTFVLAVFLTVVLWTIFTGPAAHAEDGEASWNGAALVYQGNQYTPAGKATQGQSHGLPVDTEYYVYLEPLAGSTATPGTPQKAHVIYFAPGLSPPDETTASYRTYQYVPNTRTYSSPSQVATITISATGTQSPTSCAIEGIGWIVCPIMNFLAWGMDQVFSLMSEYMEVQPLQAGNTQGSLYGAWNIMRSVANVAFIIAFLIIIYSQLTNVQVGKYGLKKLLPRLIIAALAINLSYIICAIAIDLSNILGNSLQDVFLGMRDQVLGVSNAESAANLVSWQSVTSFILSGGTAALAIGVGVAATLMVTGGTVLGLVFLLLPVLVGLLLAILVALLILAARQAIITIMVIIAPLALVAYLLPNTEKWFEKWRSLFMTMLIFFPAFSVLFGGAQLAGALIIQNAQSLNMLVLGMIVQVVPLAITPWLLRFSGSFLGNIAKMVQGQNKKIQGYTGSWAKQHQERHRLRGISGQRMNGDPGQLRRRNVLRQSAAYLEGRKTRRQTWTDNAKTGAQTGFEHSGLHTNRHYNLAVQTAAYEADKEASHGHHGEQVERAKVTPGSILHDRARHAQGYQDRHETAKNATQEYYNAERIRTGSYLNTTNNALEASKTRFEASEQEKLEYITTQKTSRVTALGIAAGRLEAAKLYAEGAQSRYTEHIESLKLSPTDTIGEAARFAQSSKEHAEAAQNRVQAAFDRERADAGTTLNLSTENLERSKNAAEGAKANLATYINELKSTRGTEFHREVIQTEDAKHAQQVSEARITRIIEEYKSGAIDPTTLNALEQSLMERMVANTEQLSAETQGAQAAKYVQQQHVAKTLADETSARGQELLDVAGSVDENGKQRALATALAQQSKTRKETLENIKAIIGFKNFSTEQVRQLAEGTPVPGIDMTQDVMATAIQMTLGGKDTKQIVQAFKNIDFSFPGMDPDAREELQVLAADALADNPARPPFMTAGFIAMMKEGKAYDTTNFTGNYGDAGLHGMIITAINNQKLDSKKLQTAGKDYAAVIMDAVSSNPDSINEDAKARLLAELNTTLDPEREASEGLGDSKPVLENIRDLLG